MARRLVRLCPGIVAVVLAWAPDAYAIEWDIFRWIEELSGPGPFSEKAKLLNVTVPFVCYAVKAKSDADALTNTVGEHVLYKDITCRLASPERIWVKIGPQISRDSGRNTLTYTRAVSDSDRETKMLFFSGVVDVAVRPFIDVGVSAGVVRFSGDAFGSVSKFAMEPSRITFKPGVIFWKKSQWRELVEVRHTTLWIPAGLKDTDFKAAPNTYKSGKEFQSTFSIVLNANPIINRFR